MARVEFNKALGIASLSGRIGNCIFYNRKGKTYVRSVRRDLTDLRGIIEPSSREHRAINEADPTFKHPEP